MKRLLAGGMVVMGLLNIMNCRSIFRKLKTGDGDYGGKIEITEDRYGQVRLEVTTSEDLDRIFEKKEAHRWTFRRPFWATWEGKKYRINGIRTYGFISFLDPVERPGMTIYGWKEVRYIQLFLLDGTVQFYLFRHDIRDDRGEPIAGPLQNYDPKIDELENMNGIGCARKIYDVVSLGRKSFDPEEFEQYCRPLIIED